MNNDHMTYEQYLEHKLKCSKYENPGPPPRENIPCMICGETPSQRWDFQDVGTVGEMRVCETCPMFKTNPPEGFIPNEVIARTQVDATCEVITRALPRANRYYRWFEVTAYDSRLRAWKQVSTHRKREEAEAAHHPAVSFVHEKRAARARSHS